MALGSGSPLPPPRTQELGFSGTADIGSQFHPLADHSQEIQIIEGEKDGEKGGECLIPLTGKLGAWQSLSHMS